MPARVTVAASGGLVQKVYEVWHAQRIAVKANVLPHYLDSCFASGLRFRFGCLAATAGPLHRADRTGKLTGCCCTDIRRKIERTMAPAGRH